MTDQSIKPVAAKAELAISKGWVQGVALVMVFGFLIMGVLAARTYSDSMPLPQQVVGPDGETVYTEQQVTSGQQIFLRRGLQQYGSVMGHGGYLGPDYTAASAAPPITSVTHGATPGRPTRPPPSWR